MLKGEQAPWLGDQERKSMGGDEPISDTHDYYYW
jgi:hypothetical protein